MIIQIVTYLMLTFCISCGTKESKPEVVDSRIVTAETNEAVLKTLNELAPEIVEMEKGIDQAIAVVSLFHNATQIKNDPRQGSSTPSDLIRATLTDSEMGLICGGFALVVFDSLTALGYENRMVQMFSNGPDNHIANEVKIDGKWIAFDGTYNVGFKNASGEFMSYKEVKEQVTNGGTVGAVYVGPSHHHLEDNYMPYEPYLYNVRALPMNFRYQAYLHEVFNGEERF